MTYGTYRKTNRQIYSKNRQIEKKKTYRISTFNDPTVSLINRKAHRQSDKHTDRKTDRLTKKHTESYC